MSYTIQDVNGCTKKLSFNFNGVDLTKQIEEALKDKQKNANLKGFRKGKAPIAMVKQVYGAQAENDALYRFVSQEFYKAIQETNIKAIGYPAFGNTKFEEGNKISFEATVEIFPEFEIKPFTGYEFKKEDDSTSEKDFEDLKARYLGPKSEMIEVTDTSKTLQNGMFAVFNFIGEKEDGSKPDNMKADEFLLEIGSGQFIPGFEEGMVGLKKGESKTIQLTFPADYHEDSLQNAKVKFHVDLLEIKEKKVPELTEELAKEFGFESVEDFNTKNKKRLADSKKREVKSKLQEEILKKLIADNKFDVPVTLLNSQRKSVQDELANNLKGQGFNESMVQTYFEKWAGDIDTKADFQVRSGLILDKLATQYKIEATDADLDAKIKEMAEQSGMEADQLASYYKANEQIKSNIMYAIREEKTFDQIISQVKLK
jgi:trigger factor